MAIFQASILLWNRFANQRKKSIPFKNHLKLHWPFYLFEWSVSISVNTCICFKAISFLSYQHQSPLRWTVPLKASRRLLIYMTFHSSFCASVNTPLSIVMYGILLLLSNLDLQISFTYYISVFSVNDIFSFSLNEKIAQTRIFNLI